MPITGLPYVLDSQLKDDATHLEDRLQANFDFLQNNIPASPQGTWLPVGKTGTYTAAGNELVTATSGTFTVTSPPVSPGRVFGVANLSTGVVTVSAASGVIYGPGSAGVASLTLGTLSFVFLVSGTANWVVTSAGGNSGWVAPTLLNAWVNIGGAFETAAYTKDANGFVHLKGVIQTGATGTTAFVLPAGFRPGAKTSNAASGSGFTASIQIDTAGNVVIPWTTSSVGLLSGITFLAEN